VWKCFSVFMRGLFFSICRLPFVSSMVLYLCCVSSMCCAYLEFGLFVLVACMCSLYLVLKFLPVCPIYFSWHFIWYMPLLLYEYMSVVCFFFLRRF
jgi:hypothetical protein